MVCHAKSFILSAGNGEYTLSYLTEHFKIMIFVIFIYIQMYPLISFCICGCRLDSLTSLFLSTFPVGSSVARKWGREMFTYTSRVLCVNVTDAQMQLRMKTIVSNLFSQTVQFYWLGM